MTFNYPRFGGHGTLDVQHELHCPCKWAGICQPIGYVGVACVEARSTDFNADGNTDQNDKLELGTALAAGSPPSYYDLTLDGTVNAADYRLVANEMVIEWNNGSIVPLRKCPGVCSQPPCQLQPVGNETHFATDTWPPGITALYASRTGCNATLTWTSPGEDVNP
ncbi:MAG: dockerin type I domain-containing protein, partial [Candidatus Eiseniibacteriota bacterium]